MDGERVPGPDISQLTDREIIDGAIIQISINEFESDEQAREFVNYCLEGSYTLEGMERWWSRPRRQLDGQTPAQAWESDNRDKVIGLAAWLVHPAPPPTS